MVYQFTHDAPPNPPAPLLQISATLARDIAAGRYETGARLPPERRLAASFGTTVRTLRKALAELERDGLIERRQGSGNYVSAATGRTGVYSMFRLELPDGGGLPTAKVLEAVDGPKPPDLPVFGTSTQASMMRRLRFLDRVPIAIEEIWLDQSAGSLLGGDLSESLYYHYQKKLGFWISRAEDRVGTASVPDWTPEAFAPARDSVVGFVERLSWAQSVEPIEYSRTWFDPDRARYVQRLT